jgi:hypothetical protein
VGLGLVRGEVGEGEVNKWVMVYDLFCEFSPASWLLLRRTRTTRGGVGVQ